MIKLKKITFFNTGRFVYGEVNVIGNTLVTGTNGAGKTTTMQSVLFFYGSTTNDKLGIPRGEGKKNWLLYTYPYPNSYVFYEYTGVDGDVLLMTYPSGNNIGYRFITLDKKADIKSIVFNTNNSVKEYKEVNAEFISLGFKPSNLITSPEKYRQILYGSLDLRVDKSLKEFAQYSLMKTEGNYNLIHEVQSSIFLSSRVETGTIENAIANSFGNDVKIDINQIRGQLHDVMEDFTAIKIYESEKILLSSIFNAYSEYISSEDGLKISLQQIIDNHKYNLANLVPLENQITSAVSAREKCKEGNSEKRTSLLADREESKSNFEYSNRELQRARKMKSKYNEAIIKKAYSVDDIPSLEIKKDSASDTYSALLGEQKDLASTYDSQIEKAQTSASSLAQARIDLDNGKINTINADIETKEEEKETDLDSLEEEYESIEKDIESRLENTLEEQKEVKSRLAMLQFKNPFKEKLDSIAKDLELTQSKLKIKSSLYEQKREYIASVIEQKENITEKMNDANKAAQERYDILKKPHEDEIKRLHKLLNVNENTLMHFIRENHSDDEGIISSLLKDEVLYSTSLNPSTTQRVEGVFGLKIDTQNLDESEYTHAKITAKINACKESVTLIKVDIDKKLEDKQEVLSKTEAKLQKKHFFANKDQDELSDAILKLQAYEVQFKEAHYEEKKQAEQMWIDSKETVGNEYIVAVSVYDLVKQEKREFSSTKSTKKNSIKNAFKEYRKTNRVLIEEIELAQEIEISRLDEELLSKIVIIEKSKVKALEEGGVSAEELSSADNLFKEAQKQYAEALSYVNEVAVWREEKKFFDTIPSLEKESITNETLYKKADSLLQSESVLMQEREEKLNKEADALESKQFKTRREIEEIQKEIESEHFIHSISKYRCEANSRKIAYENITRTLGDVKQSLSSLYKLINSIEKLLGRFTSKFGNEKHVWFTYKIDNDTETLSSVRSLKIFIEGGGIIETKELVAKSIRGIQSNIAERYGNLNTQSGKINSAIDKISKRLSLAVDDIAVLDDIGLRYVPSDNKILSELEAISQIDIPYGDLSSLFSSPKHSAKSTHLILEKFGKLLEYLQTEKAEYITVANTFEVELKAVENENSTGWIKVRKRIGSEGTSVIVKTLLYVAMLDTVLTMTRKNTKAQIHVLLDEIGKIDQRNMREVINFANKSGISFLNAAPDSKIPQSYNSIYHYKIIRGKSKIILGAVKR